MLITPHEIKTTHLVLKNSFILFFFLLPKPKKKTQPMTYSKQDTKNYVVIRPCICLLWTVILAAFVTAAFLLWPVDPEIEMEKLTVKRAKVHPLPPLSANVWLSVAVKVHNKVLCWMELAEVDVGIKYRGQKLGHVETEGWHVAGWGSAHVFGDLEFGGLPSPEVAHFMQDLGKGRVQFHTAVEVVGNLGLFFFRFPNIFKVLLLLFD